MRILCVNFFFTLHIQLFFWFYSPINNRIMKYLDYFGTCNVYVIVYTQILLTEVFLK